MGKRILTVKGTGTARRSPDRVVINFDIEVRGFDYNKVMNELNERTNLLKSDIERAGFNREDVKTTDFTIKTNYKYVNGERIFDGFIANHRLKLTFDFNKDQLNKLLTTLSDSESQAQFTIMFEVKDQEDFKNRVLEDAIRDAKRSMAVIANSTDIKIEKIININYDVPDLIARSELMLSDVSYEAGMAAIDIDPEEVTITDTITIEWEIES